MSENVGLRERLYDTLTRHGCSVKTVQSSERALATLRHERPDLLLADSSATDCGGWGLMDQIRTFDADLPIILVGHPDQDTLDTQTLKDIQASVPANAPDEILINIIDRWLTPTKPAEAEHYQGTVLIVDDEPELLRILKEFLELRHCTVVTALSGEEALERLAECDPALVLLDIKMSGMDGLVTLKKMLAIRPRLPVIMATAVQDEEMMAQAYMLGAYEYITKPYNLRALQAILLHLNTLLT